MRPAHEILGLGVPAVMHGAIASLLAWALSDWLGWPAAVFVAVVVSGVALALVFSGEEGG